MKVAPARAGVPARGRAWMAGRVPISDAEDYNDQPINDGGIR